MASMFCKYFGLVNLLLFIQFLTGCTEQTATNQIPIGVQLSSTIIDINSSGEFVAKFSQQHPVTTSLMVLKPWMSKQVTAFLYKVVSFG